MTDTKTMKTKNTSSISILFLSAIFFLMGATPKVALAYESFDADFNYDNSFQAESFLGIKEVAIAGDSWGFLACIFHSFDRALLREKNVWCDDQS